MMYRYLSVVLLFVTLSCQSNSADVGKKHFFTVVKVVDGDTFWALDEKGKRHKVRLIGIDAPETRRTGRKETGYYGWEAKEYLQQIIGGKRVRLVADVASHDRYGRVLSYVFLPNGTHVNEILIRNGYARVLTVPPNVKYAHKFLKLQQQARKKQRGLWKQGSF